MSLRILFADDSMTAQSMGKKILSEAGYEVVAVSNGAAAVKKIAEQKPDIIILDVYMPGYSGLEVCEKVRGSMETLKTPVLLTVGKMEPYRAEDGNRVRADGVIVKPFEASDLLAIVKKLEERISRAPALVEQAVLVDRFQETAEAPAELAVELPEPVTASTAQPTVEVPDHMAGNSAFSDLLGTAPSPSAGERTVSPPPAAHEVPVEPLPRAPIPDYELPVSWRHEEEAKPESEVPAPAAATPEPELAAAPAEPVAAEPQPAKPEPSPVYAPPVAARPLQIPVYREREEPPRSFEVMPTSAPLIGEIEIPREPELQETAEETTRNTIADATEPGLMTTQQYQQFESSPHSAEVEAAELAPVDAEFPTGGFQDIPADIAAHAPPPMPVETALPPPLQAEPAAGLSDEDFEARVAAALAAYGTATPASSIEAPVAASAAQVVSSAAATQVEEQRPVIESVFAEVPAQAGKTAAERELPKPEPPVPTFEYHPPLSSAEQVGVPEPAPKAARPEPEIALVSRETMTPPAAPVSETHDAVTEHLATAARAAAAAAGAGSGTDHHAISQAVHRVMERLKPELVEEIMRELKSK